MPSLFLESDLEPEPKIDLTGVDPVAEPIGDTALFQPEAFEDKAVLLAASQVTAII